MNRSIIITILVFALAVLPRIGETQDNTYTHLYNHALVSALDSFVVRIGSTGGGLTFLKTSSGFRVSPFDSQSAVLVHVDSNSTYSARFLAFGDSIRFATDTFAHTALEIGQDDAGYFGEQPTYLGFHAQAPDPDLGITLTFVGYVKICATATLDSLKIKEIGFKRYFYPIAAGEAEESDDLCLYWPAGVSAFGAHSPFTVWPNPNNGELHVNGAFDLSALHIVDVLGDDVPFAVGDNGSIQLLYPEAGVYFVYSPNGGGSCKMVVQH